MRFLRKLRLNRVDLVPAGANPGAHVALFKAAKREEDGKQFPASDYAYVPDPEKPAGWKLRLTAEPGGDPDSSAVDAAIEALGSASSEYPSEVVAKVMTAWLTAHPEQTRDDAPDVLKEAGVSKTAEELQAELDTLTADKDKAEADLKEARDKLDATPDAEIEALKSKLAEQEGELAKAKGEPDVQKQLDETKDKLEKLEKAERRRGFVAKAEADLKPLGQAEQIGRLLEAADEHFDEDEQKLFRNLLSAAAEQVEKGSLFKQLAELPDGDEPGPWEERLEKAAKERVSKSSDGLTLDQAKVQIMKENEELRREYEQAVSERS